MCTRGTWRGQTVCAHMVAGCDEIAAAVGNDIKLTIIPGFGSYQNNANSAGTGAGGGHCDFDMRGYTDAQARRVETVCRNLGLKLAYFRPAITGLWWKHVHVLFPECPSLSSAACDQFPRFKAGLDNLADNGPDTGDRTHVAQIMTRFYNRLKVSPTSYDKTGTTAVTQKPTSTSLVVHPLVNVLLGSTELRVASSPHVPGRHTFDWSMDGKTWTKFADVDTTDGSTTLEHRFGGTHLIRARFWPKDTAAYAVSTTEPQQITSVDLSALVSGLAAVNAEVAALPKA